LAARQPGELTLLPGRSRASAAVAVHDALKPRPPVIASDKPFDSGAKNPSFPPERNAIILFSDSAAREPGETLEPRHGHSGPES
jgi:hypothetical protein